MSPNKKIHRFIIPGIELARGELVITDRGIANQLIRVLRFKTGETILVCDGRRNESEVVMTRIDKTSVTVSVSEVKKNQSESKTHVTLFCAVLKREHFEFVAQKAVEVGVSEVVPVITRRTVKTGLRTDRLQTIMHEAAEQSGRGIIPGIIEPISLKQAFKKAKELDENYFFHVAGTTNTSVKNHASRIGIFIGPEGGFEESEVEEAVREEFSFLSLGPRILRAETAAIVASYLFTS